MNASAYTDKATMVKVCCIGAGYVGGLSMAVLALQVPGHRRLPVAHRCLDRNSDGMAHGGGQDRRGEVRCPRHDRRGHGADILRADPPRSRRRRVPGPLQPGVFRRGHRRAGPAPPQPHAHWWSVAVTPTPAGSERRPRAQASGTCMRTGSPRMRMRIGS